MSRWLRTRHLTPGVSLLLLTGFSSSSCLIPEFTHDGGSVGAGGGPDDLGGAGGVETGGQAAMTGGADPSGSGGETSNSGGDSSGGGSGGEASGGNGSGGDGSGGDGSGGEPGHTWSDFESYNPDFVEFVGEDCTLPAPALTGADHSLPDPFLMSDGSRMSSMSQWACQRAWLKKKVETFVHGQKPPAPDVVQGTVSDTIITVHLEHAGNFADFTVEVDSPGGGAPLPGMFRAEDGGVPVSFLHAEAVAALRYDHAPIESAFDALYGGSTAGAQIKWAWGVSRVIDVLVAQRDAGQNDVIDPSALGVTGCSYGGMSAFTVAAFDERIALGIPMESGTGGLASYRIVANGDLGPNGDEPASIAEACADDRFTSTLCSGNVDTIPADAHFLLAMHAPRGFTTLDNNRLGHLGSVAQYAAVLAGARVFQALGLPAHVGYHGGNDGDPHGHCSFNESQEETAQKAIRGFLTKTQTPANFMEPKLENTSGPIAFDLDNYVAWMPPTLD